MKTKESPQRRTFTGLRALAAGAALCLLGLVGCVPGGYTGVSEYGANQRTYNAQQTIQSAPGYYAPGTDAARSQMYGPAMRRSMRRSGSLR